MEADSHSCRNNLRRAIPTSDRIRSMRGSSLPQVYSRQRSRRP
jgi:hypothetical protein